MAYFAYYLLHQSLSKIVAPGSPCVRQHHESSRSTQAQNLSVYLTYTITTTKAKEKQVPKSSNHHHHHHHLLLACVLTFGLVRSSTLIAQYFDKYFTIDFVLTPFVAGLAVEAIVSVNQLVYIWIGLYIIFYFFFSPLSSDVRINSICLVFTRQVIQPVIQHIIGYFLSVCCDWTIR